jgi:hypothetical protein
MNTNAQLVGIARRQEETRPQYISGLINIGNTELFHIDFDAEILTYNKPNSSQKQW